MRRIALFFSVIVFIICGVSCRKPDCDTAQGVAALLRYPEIKDSENYHKVIITEKDDLSKVLQVVKMTSHPKKVIAIPIKPDYNYIVYYFKNEEADVTPDVYVDTITDIIVDRDYDEVYDYQFKFNGEQKGKGDYIIDVYPRENMSYEYVEAAFGNIE